MSKLSHSNGTTMAEIERAAAREAGDLRQCQNCQAADYCDNPICPRGGIGCNVVTVRPTMGVDRS